MVAGAGPPVLIKNRFRMALPNQELTTGLNALTGTVDEIKKEQDRLVSDIALVSSIAVDIAVWLTTLRSGQVRRATLSGRPPS